MDIRMVPQRVVDARHAKHRARRPRPAQVKAPPIRNIQPILSIGEMEFIHHRGRAYGVPPMPWRKGQRLFQLQTRLLALASQLAEEGDPKLEQEYYAGLATAAGLMWGHVRPVGKWRRFLRMFGLLRNPFHEATEKEVLEYLDFFCSRRMRSNAQFQIAHPASQDPQTSSMTG